MLPITSYASGRIPADKGKRLGIGDLCPESMPGSRNWTVTIILEACLCAWWGIPVSLKAIPPP
jgi:hypothetical protein